MAVAQVLVPGLCDPTESSDRPFLPARSYSASNGSSGWPSPIGSPNPCRPPSMDSRVPGGGDSPRPGTGLHRQPRPTFDYDGPQSMAIDIAEQISRMRSSLSLPRRLVRLPTETLSTESRFTADGRGMGSSLGSSRTSLASPRIVVVQGATRTLRSLGMAGFRERTTTGRRGISGSSHHQTSPLAGKLFTKKMQPRGTTQGHPTHPAHPVDDRHRRRTPRRFLQLDNWPRET